MHDIISRVALESAMIGAWDATIIDYVPNDEELAVFPEYFDSLLQHTLDIFAGVSIEIAQRFVEREQTDKNKIIHDLRQNNNDPYADTFIPLFVATTYDAMRSLTGGAAE